MNAARIQLSVTTLEDFLCLPAGNHITGMMWDAVNHSAWLRIEGPDMPVHERGELVREISPTYRRIEHELVTLGTEQP